MRPPEEEIRRLVGEWLKKADLDLRPVLRLSAESEFRDIVGFHAQQARHRVGMSDRHHRNAHLLGSLLGYGGRQ